jgi:hypothetical protein
MLKHMQTLQEDRLREKLRDMSKQRMSGWNNTLEARRRQKEAARQAKVRKIRKLGLSCRSWDRVIRKFTLCKFAGG